MWNFCGDCLTLCSLRCYLFTRHLDRPATTSQVYILAKTSLSRNCKYTLLLLWLLLLLLLSLLLLLLILLIFITINFYLLCNYLLLLMLKHCWLAHNVRHHSLANVMRWLAICVISHFKICWLVKSSLTRWLAGTFISWNSCSLAVKSGYFFPGTLNINEDWRRNIVIVAAILYEQFCQKWSLGTPVFSGYLPKTSTMALQW